LLSLVAERLHKRFFGFFKGKVLVLFVDERQRTLALTRMSNQLRLGSIVRKRSFFRLHCSFLQGAGLLEGFVRNLWFWLSKVKLPMQF